MSALTTGNSPQPATYLGRRNSPDFKVVWAHENLRESLADVAQIPLVKVLGLVRSCAHTCLERGINQALQTLDLFLGLERGNVVLERIWHPFVIEAHVAHALVLVPLLLVGETFVEDVVKVLVMGKDDMTTNVEQLLNIYYKHRILHFMHLPQNTHETLWGGVGRGQAAGYGVRVGYQPRFMSLPTIS